MEELLKEEADSEDGECLVKPVVDALSIMEDQ